MFEIDFLKVGERASGDAICLRFTRPDTGTLAHVVIDSGWQDDGQRVVDFIRDRYATTNIDLLIVTHPDGDHIGGTGKVVRELSVAQLLIHRLDQRGGSGLNAADAVADLVAVASARGTTVVEPFQGQQYFGGALTCLGPDESYYQELLDEQRVREVSKAAAPSLLSTLGEAARHYADRALGALPIEVPFDEGPGPGPRNNSSVITFLQLDGKRMLLTADAGVPAIERALDFAVAVGLDACAPDLVQIPHHGSRRNASSALLDRLLGPIGGVNVGNAYVSVARDDNPKHPSGRVVNAYDRRGYPWNWTAGNPILYPSSDAPPRPDYYPLPVMAPMEELPDEDSW